MDLKKFLKSHRKRGRKLNARKLARAIGVCDAVIHKWSYRKTSPDLLNALKIIEISDFVVEFEDLLTEKETIDFDEWYQRTFSTEFDPPEQD